MDIAFVLQRKEEFSGVAILSSNMKGGFDPAFVRRFHSLVYSAVLASDFEVTGVTIINALRYASLVARQRGFKEGIRRELQKETGWISAGEVDGL